MDYLEPHLICLVTNELILVNPWNSLSPTLLFALIITGNPTPWTASLASSTEVTFVLYTYLLANILFRYYIQQLYHFYSMQNETPAPSAIMVLPILSPSANIGGPEGSMNFIWSCHSNVFCIGMKVLWSRHYYKINFKHKCSFISKHIVGLTAKNDGYFIFGPRQKFC